ncbi:DNA topoisomerase 3-alpha [Nymphaea thermarum]|nr:DNA topoisomerase 3-alpha [Nymphaea thermarum]
MRKGGKAVGVVQFFRNKGEALVMGYDEMGYELWKPYLRSAMESDMKSVSVGTKRKAEVLESCLQQMKACFLDVSNKSVELQMQDTNSVSMLVVWISKRGKTGNNCYQLNVAVVQSIRFARLIKDSSFCHDADGRRGLGRDMWSILTYTKAEARRLEGRRRESELNEVAMAENLQR